MGKHVARITALGFTLAASAALVAPGVASADPSPTLGGDCAATLQNGQARSGPNGLLLDAGAPLNSPDRLTVGLDSSAKNTNGSAPLLTLPVGDTVRALGLGDVPVVGDVAAKAVCPLAQGTVNAVGNTTQGILQEAGTPPLPVPPGTPPAPPQQPNPPAPPGQTPPGDSLGPVLTGTGTGAGGAGLPGDAISGIFTNAALLPGSLVQVPVIAQIIPGAQVPTVDEQKSGTAEALPGVTPPAKLPMLLAVLALAIVAAALVRAWIRRRPA
jgi:hypothetical protein